MVRAPTDDELRALMHRTLQDGDPMIAALCAIALGLDISEFPLTRLERAVLSAHTPDSARSEAEALWQASQLA